jgi:hypothetical protein
MIDHHHRFDQKQTNTELNNYPPLQSLTPYTIHLINHTTTNTTIAYLIEKVMHTQLFTIATETDCLTNKPALIHIECVGHPSTIILVECWYLPEPHLRLFKQISRLFLSIFEPTKEIQGWGDLSIALKPFVRFNLFSMSNIQHTHFSDVQQLFREWYNEIFPHSEGCCPSEVPILGLDFICLHPTDSELNLSSVTEQYDYLSCICSHRPYKNPNDNWSLHVAMQVTFQEFLDDKCTSSPWGLGLGFILNGYIPNYLVGEQRSMKISKEKEYRRHLIEYAALICLSITKLSVAIHHQWSKHDLEHHIQSTHVQANPPAVLNTESSTTSLDPTVLTTGYTTSDYEPISNDDIIDVTNAATSVSIVPSLRDEEPELPKQQILTKKNKKRHSHHHRKRRIPATRAHQQDFHIIREVYRRFNIQQIEQILNELQIPRQYCYFEQHRQLHIVCHSPTDKIRYNDLLDDQYFTKFHYDQVFGSTSLSSQIDHILSDICQ